MRPARTRGFSWSDCHNPDGAHSLSACRRCSERRPSRLGRAASSRPLPGRSASSGQSDACRWSSLQSTVILVLQRKSRCSDRCFGAATTSIRADSRVGRLASPATRRRARTSGCAASVRNRESSVRSAPSSVPSGHRRCDPLAPVRARWRGSAVRRWRLPAALGRNLLLPCRRFRQGRMASRCRRIPAGCRRLGLLAALERSRSGRGDTLAVLRGGHSRRPGAPTRVAHPHRSDGGPP